MLLRKPNTKIFLETESRNDIARMTGLGWVAVTQAEAAELIEEDIPNVAELRAAAAEKPASKKASKKADAKDGE